MIINASVFVKDGDVNKALRILEKKLRKQGLWKYDPIKRRLFKRNKENKEKIKRKQCLTHNQGLSR